MNQEEKMKLKKLSDILIETAKCECAAEGLVVSPELEDLATKLIKSELEVEEVSKFLGKISELCRRFIKEDSLDI